MTLKKLRENSYVIFISVYLRFILGGAFVFSAPVKIMGQRFTLHTGEWYDINTAWHLFETLFRSGLYWQFLGLVQITTGFLLMTQKYAKIGVLIFVPIILNIFIITISYDFNLTHYITGFMLLSSIFLLLLDFSFINIKGHLYLLIESESCKRYKVSSFFGLLLFSFIAIYRFVYLRHADINDVIIVSIGSGIILICSLFFGIFKEINIYLKFKHKKKRPINERFLNS